MRIDDSVREGVIAIAHAAAADILTVYAQDFDVERKADASPLTAADLAAHRRIVAGLAALTPDIPVLSEESADACIKERKTWTRYWLVDPLDGTREFVKKNGEFSVNIALIDAGVAVFGVIQQPVTGLLWHGTPGQGAYRREGHDEARIHCRQPATSPLTIAASRSHRDPHTDAVIATFAEAKVISLGSSLKFCRIAEGTLDLYPRFGPTSEWDTAAGQAIVQAAGGVLFDRHGRPFRYNQRETLLNGDFFACGDVAVLHGLIG